MQSLHHQYSPIWMKRLFTTLFDILGLLFSIFSILVLLNTIATRLSQVTLENTIEFILLWAFFCLCFLIPSNFTPEIISDSEGLHITFLWKRYVVPWEGITDLKPLFNLPILKHHKVIRTRALTPFHRIYGLIYSFSIAPCIIYNKDISHYNELEQRIRTGLKKN